VEREASQAQPDESLLSVVADLEREADLLIEAARAEARQVVEDARRTADALVRAARADALEVERRAFEEEVARGRAAADALRAAWPQRRAALEAEVAVRLPAAVAAVVGAVLGTPGGGGGPA
jgi:vacuolar-type H+-ATPase subunit H